MNVNMKKSRIILGLGMTALLCAACTDAAADYTASSEEILVPDNVEVPDAASTVEKILNKEDVLDIPDMDEEALQKLESEAEAAENAETTDIDIYYVFGSYDNFEVDNVELSAEYTAEDVLGVLSSHNIVPIDCKVEGFEIEDGDNGEKTIIMNLSANFNNYLSTMSQDARDAIINSLTDTFLKAFDADELYLNSDNEAITLSDSEDASLKWASNPIKK